MKKNIIFLFTLIIMLTYVLVGCGQVTGKCEECGKNAPLYVMELYDKTEPKGTEPSEIIRCRECMDTIEDATYKLINYLGVDNLYYEVKKYTGH